MGYITLHHKLLSKEKAIIAARDQKLAQATTKTLNAITTPTP